MKPRNTLKPELIWCVALTICFVQVTTCCRPNNKHEDKDEESPGATTMPTPYFNCTVDRVISNVTEVTVKNSSNTNGTACKIAIFNMTDFEMEGQEIFFCNFLGFDICPNCSSTFSYSNGNVNASCLPLMQGTTETMMTTKTTISPAKSTSDEAGTTESMMSTTPSANTNLDEGHPTANSYTGASTKTKRNSSTGQSNIVAIALSALAAIIITAIVIAISVKRNYITLKSARNSENTDATGHTIGTLQAEETGDPYTFATEAPMANNKTNPTGDVAEPYAVVNATSLVKPNEHVETSKKDDHNVIHTTFGNESNKEDVSETYAVVDGTSKVRSDGNGEGSNGEVYNILHMTPDKENDNIIYNSLFHD